MARLTLEQVSRENQNREAASTTSLHLSHRALSDVSCLGAFQSLEKLDISSNCLLTLEGLSSCGNLKWLSVVENKLESLKGIECLSKLTVLNAGKNKLRTMDEISSVTSLRALILNDNSISSICKLVKLEYLNTLVLSRNPIYEIGDSLKKVKSITKLSLSHCQIQTIGSSLMSCVDLKEVRFAHNKISDIPSELALNVKLQTLDLGNNLIENWSDIKVLSSMHHLKSLNLQGNPIAEKDKLAKKVKKLVPNLRIFNGKPIERSNARENIFGEDTLSHSKDECPIDDASDVEAERGVKRRKPKIDAKVSGRRMSKRSSKEVGVLPRSSNVEAGKKTKGKESKGSADVRKKNISIPVDDEFTHIDTDVRSVKKKSKRKPENREESIFGGIDNVETPILDLILSGKTLGDSGRKKADREAVPDARIDSGLVVDHTRKKAAKTVGTGRSAVQLLSPVLDVGMGGPSTWVD